MTNFFTTQRKFILAAALALAVAGLLRAAGATPAPVSASAEKRPITIVTTIRPLELIVSDLIGEDLREQFTVTALLSPSVSPHGFEPTAAQVARLHRADIVIYNGGGLDDWAGRGLPSGVTAIRIADVADHHHEDGKQHACCAHGHSHDGGSDDEHFWLDVELVKQFVGTLNEQLSDLARARFDEAEADRVLRQLRESVERFRAQAHEVDQAFALSLKPYRNRRIVTHHNVFSRFARRHELGDPLVLRPLASAEPTPRDLRRAIRTIRAERVAAILIEPQFNAASADRIRDETSVRLVVVDPLGAEASSWREMMHAIRTAIIQCFDQP